jgi:GTP-binding protein
MAYAPIAFITGQTGKNVKALLNHGQMLYKQASTRVPTNAINRLVKAALKQQQPAMMYGKRPKIYFASQISTNPPTIVMMCNNPQGFSAQYQRYLLGVLRDHLPFGEVPIKFYLQKRDSHTGAGPGEDLEPIDDEHDLDDEDAYIDLPGDDDDDDFEEE